MLKTRSKVALGLLGTILVLALGILAVIESRYQILFASPEVSYETVVQPTTSIRLVVRPPLAKDLILKRFAKQAPPWLIERALPYEAAFLLSPDLEAGRIAVTLFVNDKRLGPVMATAPAQINLARLAPPVTWTGTVMERPRRGVLRLDGYAALPSLVLQTVQANWGVVAPLTHPGVEGGHLLEVAADNRDGSLFDLIATLDANHSPALGLPIADLARALLPIAVVRVRGDLAEQDSLSFDFEATCRPQAEDSEASAVDFQFGLLLGAVAKELNDRYQVEFKGIKKREGLTISGNYTLAPLQRLLI
jgi:hypothetical protein